jgi:hypothetical protein
MLPLLDPFLGLSSSANETLGDITQIEHILTLLYCVALSSEEVRNYHPLTRWRISTRESTCPSIRRQNFAILLANSWGSSAVARQNATVSGSGQEILSTGVRKSSSNCWCGREPLA